MIELQRYLALSDDEGTTEVFNGKRTKAYLDAGLVNGWESPPAPFNCDHLLVAIADGTFVDPATDPAPWYDATDARSEHFFGFAVRTFVTDVVPYERVGAGRRRLGRWTPRQRRFVAEVDVLADDCCGVDFAKQWLAHVFGGLCSPCPSKDAYLYSCDAPLRTSFTVGLVSVDDITPAGLDCCFGARLRISFASEIPWLYSEAISVLAEASFAEGATAACPTWTPCPPPSTPPCADPDAAAAIAPLPVRVVTGPNAPGGVGVAWCDPLSTLVICGVVDAFLLGLPTVVDAALRFTISAGASAMRNLKIQVFPGDCAAGPAAPAVDPIAEMLVTYIPAGETLVIDGATRSVALSCDGEWVNAEHLIYGPTGALWSHPTLGADCDGRVLCVCATADAANTDAAAAFTLEAIPRYI